MFRRAIHCESSAVVSFVLILSLMLFVTHTVMASVFSKKRYARAIQVGKDVLKAQSRMLQALFLRPIPWQFLMLLPASRSFRHRSVASIFLHLPEFPMILLYKLLARCFAVDVLPADLLIAVSSDIFPFPGVVVFSCIEPVASDSFYPVVGPTYLVSVSSKPAPDMWTIETSRYQAVCVRCYGM